MSPFSFFKKKDKDISKFDKNISSKSKSMHRSEDVITTDFALQELERKENDITLNRLDKLKTTCEEIKQSYRTINNIAINIEMEEINVEEEKLTPLIKNTKNIIVKSLKRESANTLGIPKTFEDLTKFKETIISSINRFGEVTSSHSTVINTFMKKHANQLRSELKKITENSEIIDEFYNDILRNKEAIEKCKNNLKDINNKSVEIDNSRSIIESIGKSIMEKENENDEMGKQIEQLRALPSYDKGLGYLREIEKLEKEKDSLIQNYMEISNQLSKATHKYSYGTSKGTKEIINTLIKEPSKIINDEDISPYLEFLENLKESINTNKIQLKDSTKVIQYCDRLIDALPKFKQNLKGIVSKLKHLKDYADNSTLEEIKKIEDRIKENKKTIHAESLRREEFNRQKTQEEEKSRQLVDEIEEQLFHICRKRYKITTQAQPK
jgi:hypothetical protein